WETLRAPEPRAELAEPLLDKVEEAAPPVAGNRIALVRVNAVTQVVGGALLALDRWPRLSAAALSLTLVPATLGGHRFWEHEDEQQREQQQMHFLKNVAILGGLLAVAGS